MARGFARCEHFGHTLRPLGQRLEPRTEIGTCPGDFSWARVSILDDQLFPFAGRLVDDEVVAGCQGLARGEGLGPLVEHRVQGGEVLIRVAAAGVNVERFRREIQVAASSDDVRLRGSLRVEAQ